MKSDFAKRGFRMQIEFLMTTIARNRMHVYKMNEEGNLPDGDYNEWLDKLDSLERLILEREDPA